MLLVLYNLLFPFALLATFPFYLRRMLKRGNYARNFGQRFGLYSRRLKDRLAKGKWTWIRAVSVGEVGMAVRLLQELHRQLQQLFLRERQMILQDRLLIPPIREPQLQRRLQTREDVIRNLIG